jgi:hypothetical protein
LERTIEYGETYDAGLPGKPLRQRRPRSGAGRSTPAKARIGRPGPRHFFHTALDGYLSVNDKSAEVQRGNLTAPVAGSVPSGTSAWARTGIWKPTCEVYTSSFTLKFEGDLAAVALVSVVQEQVRARAGGNVVRLDIHKDPEDSTRVSPARSLFPASTRLGAVFAF